MQVCSPAGIIKNVDATDPYNNKKVRGLYIAGLFAVRREIFIDAGMYDEKMKFGENTELGYRIAAATKKAGFTHTPNVKYFPSSQGGSKNLYNKLYSNLYLLEKHKTYFTKHKRSKKLFMKVAAVAAARLGKFKLARKLFFETLLSNKIDFKLLLQFIISCSPILSKRKWGFKSTQIGSVKQNKEETISFK
jgi:hypothetical protein